MRSSNLTLTMAAFALAKPVGFAGTPVKLKVDAAGNAVLTDGKPTYETDDGKEFVADVAGMHSKITALGNEAKEHRTRADTAEAKLKPYDGIDPVAARAAIQTAKDIKDGELIAKGEVERVRQEIKSSFEGQIATLTETNKTLGSRLTETRIGNAFANAQFIKDKLTLPADMIRATFGSNFTINDKDQIVAKDASGNVVFSRKKAGDYADFDEALEILVDAYPHKAQILKGSNNTGSGNTGGGGNNGAKKVMTRAEFEKLPPVEQGKFAAEMRAGTASIPD